MRRPAVSSLAVIAVLVAHAALFVAPRETPAEEAPPPPAPGKALVEQFLREQVRAQGERSRRDLERAEPWPELRARLRGELRDMLGLDPEPPRGDLRAVVTGVSERADLGIAVEKLHFQSLPGLYVTANLYRPLQVRERLPAVLYLCGHGQVKLDGVSYGNKALYQHHPAWFARHGYVSLVIDTLQLGEIEGQHHGTYKLDMWWWPSRGYTPAGVEAWNSIRALDYLETRPEVDAGRIGVTGRSGGGIGSWWLAALDDRPAALVPVAGITDLEDHIVGGAIDGHCDCNFVINIHGWDYAAVAALAAPRPVLHANSDKDRIFPLGGVYRVHQEMRTLYDRLGASDRLGLLITEGPHQDTQELQVPAFRWMERWLRGEAARPVAVLAEKFFDPKDLKVFASLPADERNTTAHEWFVPAREPPPVPADLAAFDGLRRELLAGLAARTFKNAPRAGAALESELHVAVERDGLLLRGYRFRSEGPFRLPLWVVSGARHPRPSLVVLTPVDERGWEAWLGEVAGSFAAELGAPAAAGDPERAAALRRLLDKEDWAFAVLEPRGIGPTRWASSPKEENGIRRRFLALGRTVEEARVLDVRRAIRAVSSIQELAAARLWIQAEREMALISVYAGLFEPEVKRFDLHALPASHREGVALLNVLRVLDVPQAVSLLLPRRVFLHGVREADFAWAKQAAALHETEPGKSPLVFRDPAGEAAPAAPPEEKASGR
jgi:dienelactone hydrolase